MQVKGSVLSFANLLHKYLHGRSAPRRSSTRHSSLKLDTPCSALLDPNRKLDAILKRDIVDQSCAQHSAFHSAWALGRQSNRYPKLPFV